MIQKIVRFHSDFVIYFLFTTLFKLVASSFHKKVADLNKQGWRSGESTRLPPMWPRFESWRWRYMWVEFVVDSLPCSRGFFSGYSGFPLSLKTNTFKFQFDLERTDVSTSSYELLSAPWVNKLQFTIYLQQGNRAVSSAVGAYWKPWTGLAQSLSCVKLK